MRWKVLGLVVFAVIVATFTLINTTKVTVDFLFAKTQVSLVLVILLSLLFGMILMAILWSLRAWQLRGQRNELRRHVTDLEHALQEAKAKLEVGEENANVQGSVSDDTQAGGVNSASQASHTDPGDEVDPSARAGKIQ